MLSVIEKMKRALAIQKRERLAEGWPGYRSLLQAVIDEREDIPPDEVEAVLESVGKSIDDIPKDAERLRKRLALADQVKQGKSAATRIDSERKRLEGLRTELQEARNRLEPQIRTLSSQVRAMEQLSSDGAIAVDELFRSCMDPSLVGQHQDLQRELMDRLQERQQVVALLGDRGMASIRSVLGVAEQNLAKWTEILKNHYGKNEYARKGVDYWQTVVDHVSRRQSSAQELLETIDQDVARIRNEQDAVRLKMETP
jgi:peptidoglycan hydrolase CwlO-like protein